MPVGPAGEGAHARGPAGEGACAHESPGEKTDAQALPGVTPKEAKERALDHIRELYAFMKSAGARRGG